MKSRDIELKCPKPNVYVLTRIVAEGDDIPLLMWNSKTVRVYCDSVKGKGDVMAINAASESFRLGIIVARLADKLKLRQLTVADGYKAITVEPKVTLERDLVAVAQAAPVVASE